MKATNLFPGRVFADRNAYAKAYRDEILAIRHQWDVLLAVDEVSICRARDLPEIAGINNQVPLPALNWLASFGLVRKVGTRTSHAGWAITERGKIVAALYRGKQTAANAKARLNRAA